MSLRNVTSILVLHMQEGGSAIVAPLLYQAAHNIRIILLQIDSIVGGIIDILAQKLISLIHVGDFHGILVLDESLNR
jgi:hypothetical protein